MNLPPTYLKTHKPSTHIYEGWRFSIFHVQPALIGIFWDPEGHAKSAHIVLDDKIYQGVKLLIQLILADLDMIHFDMESLPIHLCLIGDINLM